MIQGVTVNWVKSAGSNKANEALRANAIDVGFSTYEGTVTAASDWGEPAERKRVLPALPGSYEALLHRAGVIEPRYARAWLYSGVALYQMGERKRAMEAFPQAMLSNLYGPTECTINASAHVVSSGESWYPCRPRTPCLGG